MMDALFWLPDSIGTGVAVLLVIAAAVTSAVTASFGVGGGVLLLALLALALPPSAIIPVHGMVQFGSNANRALMTWRHIDWRRMAAFVPGVILGAWLASLFLVVLPQAVLQLTIALFILFLCWGPALPARTLGRTGTAIAGLVTTFLSMFVGATGPLVAAFIRQQHDGARFATVANFATAMSFQHLPKALVFGASGFLFWQWLPLIVAMIISGAVGTWLGLQWLKQMSNARFNQAFKWLLTLLAARLLWQALSAV